MLTILMGKSAVGKDTVQRELLEEGFECVVTATTRAMREGEEDGISYRFMNNEQFDKAIAKNEFVEHTEFNGVKYGCPKEAINLEKDMCIVLEPEGVQNFINEFGRENLFVVSLQLDENIRQQRAAARGSYSEESWQERVASDNERFRENVVSDLANYRINTQYMSVDEIAYDIVSALDAYDSYNKTPDEKYIVNREMIPCSYYEEPECNWKVYLQEDLKKNAGTGVRISWRSF